MERYLAAFRSGDDALAIGVPHAHYWSFGFRRWTFLGPPDRTGPEREASDAAQVALFHAVMDRFLDGAEGSLAHACVGMISLAREKRLPLDEDRLAACEARAVASEDGYLRNRGQIMAGQTPLLQAVPPRRVD